MYQNIRRQSDLSLKNYLGEKHHVKRHFDEWIVLVKGHFSESAYRQDVNIFSLSILSI